MKSLLDIGTDQIRPRRLTIDQILDSEDPISAIGLRLDALHLNEMTYEEEWFLRVSGFYVSALNCGLLEAIRGEGGTYLVEIDEFARAHCTPRVGLLIRKVRGLFGSDRFAYIVPERVRVIDELRSLDGFYGLFYETAFAQCADDFRSGLLGFVRVNRRHFENLGSIGV